MKTLHQQIEIAGNKVYGQVNRMWPDELPILEKVEAQRAYKRLITKFGKKKVWCEYLNEWETKKLYAGRKRPRKCWLSLNGDTNSLSKGWRRLVHDVSHYVHDFRFSNSKDHNIAQAKIEFEMAKFVIDSGWLQGKLKPKIKPLLTKEEKNNKKILHYQSLLKRWETKHNLATTKIKIYRKKLKNLR
tara:strand:+ start:6522 stop:7082 length:561 start_codon:yes stop_codon:yes gene_type:complete